MQDARIRGALLLICLACLLGSGIVLLRGRQAGPPSIVFSPAPAAPAKAAADTLAAPAAAPRSTRLFVDVAGAVRRPSLYLLPPDSRVMQAVMAAGGPTASADIDAVNLAQPVTDGEKVFVPNRGAARQVILPVQSSAVAGMAPKPGSLSSVPAKASKSLSKGSSSHSNKLSADSGEQVGLNSATVEQLERLPGVGPSMAARILDYRQQAGGFGKVEDLMMVTGIGPKKFAKIAPCVTLN